MANFRGASMKAGIFGLISFLLIALAVWYFSRVDERPMPVKVVEAFPRLEWPDWLRGIDEGFSRAPRPLVIAGAGDGTNRIFVATQYGTIHVWPNHPDAGEMQTFLDIRDHTPGDECGGEEGFLGLAFHPRYKENGQFFVYYSEKPTPESAHTTVLS